MESIFEKMGGTYIKSGDYYIPNLYVDNSISNDRQVGKYGMLRETFLKEHHSSRYNQMLLCCKLHAHLADIEEQSQHLLNTLIPQMMKQENVTEELKANSQMEWVGRMNNIKARVEEIIFSEIVYN